MLHLDETRSMEVGMMGQGKVKKGSLRCLR